MTTMFDVEQGENYKVETDSNDAERQALLASGQSVELDLPDPSPSRTPWSLSTRRFTLLHLLLTFFSTVILCVTIQRTFFGRVSCPLPACHYPPAYLADAGSTEIDRFPAPSPSNVRPSLFPTDVGYAGVTRTGAEAALIATAPAYPAQSCAAGLVVPTSVPGHKHGSDHKAFDMLKTWGNLSPWYSVGSSFGLHATPEAPDTCRITGMHLLHRHGARYPTSECEKLDSCACRHLVLIPTS